MVDKNIIWQKYLTLGILIFLFNLLLSGSFRPVYKVGQINFPALPTLPTLTYKWGSARQILYWFRLSDIKGMGEGGGGALLDLPVLDFKCLLWASALIHFVQNLIISTVEPHITVTSLLRPIVYVPANPLDIFLLENPC